MQMNLSVTECTKQYNKAKNSENIISKTWVSLSDNI